MNNNFSDLYFEKNNFNVEYSESEKKGHKKDMFRRGLEAADDMDREKKKIEDLGENVTSDNLPVDIKDHDIFENTDPKKSHFHQ